MFERGKGVTWCKKHQLWLERTVDLSDSCPTAHPSSKINRFHLHPRSFLPPTGSLEIEIEIHYQLESLENKDWYWFLDPTQKLPPMFFFWIRSEEVLSHRSYVGNSISQSDKESPIVKSPWDKVWFSAFLLLLSSVIESSQISISFQFVKLRAEWGDQNIFSLSVSQRVSQA